MRGFIHIVNRFYLVIYTDEDSSKIIIDEINKIQNDTVKSYIKVFTKPYTDFYNYKYAEYWKNNNNNPECKLYDVADWRLNMLWCEKVHFVNQTMEGRYFDTNTDYYGWCDIGYFRDTLAKSGYANLIRERWPNPAKLNALDITQVYYGCNIRPDHTSIALKYYLEHFSPSNIDNKTGIPRTIYHKKAHLISGGFFITGREKMKWWVNTFQTTLEAYIAHNAVIQDDQQLISDCIFRHHISSESGSERHFRIMKVNETLPDKLWFMFRDILL
jgi:hypothetical protein